VTNLQAAEVKVRLVRSKRKRFASVDEVIAALVEDSDTHKLGLDGATIFNLAVDITNERRAHKNDAVVDVALNQRIERSDAERRIERERQEKTESHDFVFTDLTGKHPITRRVARR
jgi:hypothetical protein